MGTLTTLLSDQTIERIGWVLVHFLWQGCAVMALMWCVLKMLGKASSNMRYLVACLGLSLMVLSPVVTFIIVDNHTAAAAPETAIIQSPATPTTQPSAEPQSIVISYTQTAVPEKSLMQIVTAQLEAALPYCVIGLIIGVGALRPPNKRQYKR